MLFRSMLSQALKHAMNIYVFWLIVFFSAFIGVFSTYLIGWIEKPVSPVDRAMIKAKHSAKKKLKMSAKETRIASKPRKLALYRGTDILQ